MPSVLGRVAAAAPATGHHGRQPMKVSKDAINSSVSHICAKAWCTRRLPRTAQAAALWPPPRVQKKPLSSKPGKLASVHVLGSSRRASPPNPSSQCQNNRFALAASSPLSTSRIRTTPLACKCCSHPPASSSWNSGISITRGGWKRCRGCRGKIEGSENPAPRHDAACTSAIAPGPSAASGAAEGSTDPTKFAPTGQDCCRASSQASACGEEAPAENAAASPSRSKGVAPTVSSAGMAPCSKVLARAGG
mmetsp:Transcript_133771/g.333874  ORF Transcript_133771/g.333874 Transcript_133771/m.333874 type:complete len:249 (+) Transcript_133771:595-1341(+)